MDTTNNSEPTMPSATSPQPPPPALPPARPPASPPKAEDDLDVALNGQEPTVKNLIMAAIGVMKVRFKDSLASETIFDHGGFSYRIERPDQIANA